MHLRRLGRLAPLVTSGLMTLVHVAPSTTPGVSASTPADIQATSAPTTVSVAGREGIVRRAFERIDREDRRFGAFTARNSSAYALARRLDLEFGSASAGPLDGKVLAVKANIDLASIPATAGVRLPSRSARTPPTDAFVVTRIVAAGGIIVGTTNMDSWARGTRSVSEFGSTGNAFDPNRSPLGSSGGSAVAVATGMVDMALGTDTCGSIRYPAAANKIFGLRPTPEAVSRSGVVPLSPTQDVVGPLARTVDDLRVLFGVIAATDPLDPRTAASPMAPGRARSRRVGVLRGFGSVSRNPQSPLALLRTRGYELIEVSPAGLERASVIDDEFARSRDLWRRGEPPWSLTVSGGYRSRLASQARLRSRLLQILERENLDVMVYPTTTAPPGRRGARQTTGNCWLSANSGLPALAVPGPLVEGFPEIGVDLLGRPFDEETLFALATDAS